MLRHRQRTAIALCAIGFSVVALIFAGGFIEWIFWALREATVQSGLGHIQVMRPGFRTEGTANLGRYLLTDDAFELAALEADPGVRAVTQRLTFNGLISVGETTVSFLGEGADVAREPKAIRNLAFIAGHDLLIGEPKGITVGVGLADKLGLKVGDRVVLLVNTPRGGVAARECSVQGIHSTQVKAADDISVRVPLALARDLTKMQGSHRWIILLPEAERTDAVLAALRARLDPKKFEIVPWYELADFYKKLVPLLTQQFGFVKLIIGVIIVLSISNTMIMSVLERTGEIGTLMAMGTRRRSLLLSFLIEGAILGFIGGLIGTVVGVAIAYAVSAFGIPMPPPPGRTEGYRGEILVTLPLLVSAWVIAIVPSLVSSIYPAWKASRLDVVDALRHNR